MDTPELRATAQGPADLWVWRWLSWARAVSGAICWLLREQPGGNVCVGRHLLAAEGTAWRKCRGRHLLADEGTIWCRSPPQPPRSSGSPCGQLSQQSEFLGPGRVTHREQKGRGKTG